MSDSFNPSKTGECVFKCEDVERLLPFPDEKVFRDLWLYKLSLSNYDESYRVCNQHFSETMLPTLGGELVELAVPDRNVPSSPVLKNKFYDKLMNILIQPPDLSKKQKDKLLKQKAAGGKKKDSLKTLLNVEASKGTNVALSQNLQNTSFPSSTNVSSMTNLESNQQGNNYWLNDTSTLLMDYQLRVQGRHVCDVIELPEYVVVFTVVKPKNLPSKPDAQVQTNMNALPAIPSTAELFPTEAIVIDDNDEPIPDREQTPEIDYVYYSLTEDSVPTREREVQVEIPNNTCETAIQCDVELDNDMLQMAYAHVHRTATHSPILRVGMYECHICGEIMPNYSAKVRHESGHKKRTSLCPRCGEVFSNPIKLKVHESDAHLGSELDIRKALRCPKLNCNKAFHSRKQLNNHIDDHMGHIDHKCIKCRRLFSSAIKLNCHLKAFKECYKYSRSITRRWSRRE